MHSQSEERKRIVKNTFLLYVRMIVVMAVSFYTSRVVLNTLGVENYGIHNVVGGLVSMFSMISGSIGTSITRFLTYDLGKGDINKLSTTFSTSINIQIIFAVIILIIAEFVGVWFLNYKMNIPGTRMYAANWVFQFSLGSFCLGLISVPYYSLIVAYEKMGAFALFNILEAVFKLIIVLLITLSPFDKLIFYSFLLFCVSLLIRILYGAYCKYHYPEITYHLICDKHTLKEMGKFTGWNYIGACAFILRNQGINLLLNLFFGVTVNAARGIASQIEAVVTQCAQNLALAFSPQITKSYAQGNKSYLQDLICFGAKYTFFMSLIIIIPLLYETPVVLKLWLKNVPEYAVIFTRYTLLLFLSDCMSNTLTDAILASGDIKKLQIMAGCVVLPVIPLTYLLFLYGYPPDVCYIPCIISLLFKFIFEIYYVRDVACLPISRFFVLVLSRVIPTSLVILFVPSIIVLFFNESITRFVVLTIISIIWSLFSIYLIGLTRKERTYIIEKTIPIVRKFKNIM